MTPQQSMAYIFPELLLGLSACILFLLSAFSAKIPKSQILFPVLAFFSLVAALASLIGIQSHVFVQNLPGSLPFFGLISIDPFIISSKILIVSLVVLAVFLNLSPNPTYKYSHPEYYGLLLTFALGLLFFTSSNHLLMLYVGMEAVSLCSYLLAGFDQKHPVSRETGLKYVLYGGVASGVMLFGLSLLYGLTGDLSFSGLRAGLISPTATQGAGLYTLLFATVLILAGLGFKLSLVPFHSWCPDVYQGAPTPFVALLSTAPKAAAFTVLLRFLYHLFSVNGYLPDISISSLIPWVILLGFISAASMTLGNLSALNQISVKRMLAYSSIAHAGYMLMGVLAGDRMGFQAVWVNLVVYAVMNFGAFAVVCVVEDTIGSDHIHSFKGLSRKAPFLSFCMAVFLISLAGLPPTAGFIGKFYLFNALLQKSHPGYLWLSAWAVLNSVLSFYYYARILKAIYLENDPTAKPPIHSGFHPGTLIAGLMVLPLLYFGIFWNQFAVFSKWAATLLR